MMSRLARFSNTKHGKHRALPMAIGLSVLLMLPGCCLPKLHTAEHGPALPDSYVGVTTPDNSAEICWAQFFNDPTLASLVGQAMVGNQELKILNQNVQIANYEVFGRSGAYLPFVSLGGGANLAKPGLYTPEGAVEEQLQVLPGKNFPEPLPDFLAAADISWEVDIWKRLRNAKQAAAYRWLGTADGQNYIATRIVAEVAENYYQLMALDNRMATLDSMIQIQQRSLETAKDFKIAGRDTELPVQRFEAEVRKNQSEKLIVQQQIVEVENRINFLLGRFPQRVERDSSKFLDMQLNALAVGVPPQLLQNRGDIRQAEREIQATGLDVRVARARFFPSLNINAGVGYEAFQMRYLFVTPESLIYNVGANLVGPLINRRAIKADYLTANARQLQAVYDYQKTTINAFTEVVNHMAKVQNYGASIAVKRQQLKALEESVGIATDLFQAAHPGTEYIDVLLAQRDFMEAKMVLIDTKQEQLAAIIKAYQALGGGGVPPGAPIPGDPCYVPPVEVIPPAGVIPPPGMTPPPPVETIPPGQPVAPGPGTGPYVPPPAPTSPQPELLPPGAQQMPPNPNDPNGGGVASVQHLPPV